MRSGSLFVLGVAALLTSAGGTAMAAGLPLATYRAVHDFVLDPKEDDPDVGEMTGRMVTEFKGSACSAYTTTTRFVTQGTDSDDQQQIIDTRNITIEKPDGTFDFDNETYENGKQTEIAKGLATRAGGGVEVKLKQPARKTLDLSAGVLFPTEQTTHTIDAALAGQRLISFDTYDGLDDGQTVSPATVVIGAASNDPSDVGEEAPIADAGYATMTHWPITVSYFDSDAGTDQTPDYVMSALLYENGILRHLRLDYGSFALIGKLVQLDKLPTPACP